MKKLMIGCLTAAGFCGVVVVANADSLSSATPLMSAGSGPVAESGTSTELPYVVAKLQGEMQQLRVQVQNLQANGGEGAEYSQAVLSAEPLPNHDDAPIPNGDYSPGW